jgi:hypothetical protein
MLLQMAGITQELQAQAVRKAWDKKVELLEAQTTRHFAHEGRVKDSRVVADNRTQLDSAEALDQMIGVKAPKADQQVVVTHRLELPSWAMPDSLTETKVIDVTPINDR